MLGLLRTHFLPSRQTIESDILIRMDSATKHTDLADGIHEDAKKDLGGVKLPYPPTLRPSPIQTCP